ncbi:D-glycero-alpha-D-manno-heptose-1,7-bisphosphate 7-phosphatase [Xanthobacter pseudotagetidis]|uniref:D-glycero-alpha-D-manno-heptose-1,7-bisphosphate 7-phosphatase n=1 Tax=Xanthobacter pseudotagetidis TaxID=3119911 RepID=UPI0037271BB0
MRAGHAFAEDAPDVVVVLLGATDTAADGDPARLQRLIAEAGRHGFRSVHIFHAPACTFAVNEALGSLPALEPMPQVDSFATGSPFATLRTRLPELGARVLVASGLTLPDFNWLDLMAALAPARAGVAALYEGAADAAFLLEEDRALPGRRLGDAPRHGFANLALLEHDALAGLGDAVTLAAALRRLAEAGTLGGRLVPPPARLPTEIRSPRPALFLDRDGTLNVDYGYVYDPERLVFLPGAAAAVKQANDLGFYVFLVTNQSGVGRGYYTEADVDRCNATLQRHLRAFGAHLDDIRYCSDHPDALIEAHRRPTGWRKPAPGMLIDLMEHWPVVREKSLMVGDKDSDMGAGRAAGVDCAKFETEDLAAFLGPLLLAERNVPEPLPLASELIEEPEPDPPAPLAVTSAGPEAVASAPMAEPDPAPETETEKPASRHGVALFPPDHIL